MSELHKFLFDGLPVRGMIVRLTDAWTEILARRRTDDAAAAWPWPVAELLGEKAEPPIKYRINLKTEGQSTTVSVLNANGAPEASANAQRIVQVIADDLK
jgi:redox-regulated HSP33 family molecular chaperone